MAADSTAAERFLAREQKRQNEEYRKEEERQQAQWAREARERDARHKEWLAREKMAILKTERDGGVRSETWWLIGTIICLLIPVIGWMVLLAACCPCNWDVQRGNRIRVMAAAERGDDALDELTDIGRDIMMNF